MKGTRVTMLLSVTLAGALLTGACSAGNPCAALLAPTEAEIVAAQQGADIERDVPGGECDLENGVWVFDRDSKKRRATTVVVPPTRASKPTFKPTLPARPSQSAKPTKR